MIANTIRNGEVQPDPFTAFDFHPLMHPEEIDSRSARDIGCDAVDFLEQNGF